MGRGAHAVADLCVRRQFRATLGARPLFCCLHQGATDPFTPMRVFDEPTLKVSDPAGVTTFGVWADGKLSEADGPPGLSDGDEHLGGVTAIPVEEKLYLCGMLARGRWPELLPHPLPIGGITLLNGSYVHDIVHLTPRFNCGA